MKEKGTAPALVAQGEDLSLIFDTVYNTKEFTMLYVDEQPVNGNLTVTYSPIKGQYLDPKGFRKYLDTYRQKVLTYEQAGQGIFIDLWRQLKPYHLRLELTFCVRGGLEPKIVLDSEQGHSALGEPYLNNDDDTKSRQTRTADSYIGKSEDMKDILEVFPNPKKDERDSENPGYVIEFQCPEFTSLCPKTGQPDYAVMTLIYRPKDVCVELKSLKQYFWAYRQHGMYMEGITNKIKDDLVEVLDPQTLEIEAVFFPRGGVHHRLTASYINSAEDWRQSL